MVGPLLVGIPKSEQHRLGERPGHELNPDGEPVCGEPCGHRHRWKTQDRTQTTVITEAVVVDHGFGHHVGRNEYGLMVERRVHQRVQLVIGHQA